MCKADKKRLVALLLAVCMVFFVLFTLLVELRHGTHNCADEHCAVCFVQNAIRGILRKLRVLGFAALAGCLFVRYGEAFPAAWQDDIPCVYTPVKRKVRINP